MGSLKEELSPARPGDMRDQFVNRTRGRVSTFFGNGLVLARRLLRIRSARC